MLPVLIFLPSLIFLNCAALTRSGPVLIKDHELKGGQRHEWNYVKTEWFRKEYRKILKEFNIEMNCSDCEYAYITVRLHIDNNGHIVKIDIVKEHICRGGASEKMKEAFLKYFRNVIPPESVRNIIIETMLGTGLSC